MFFIDGVDEFGNHYRVLNLFMNNGPDMGESISYLPDRILRMWPDGWKRDIGESVSYLPDSKNIRFFLSPKKVAEGKGIITSLYGEVTDKVPQFPYWNKEVTVIVGQEDVCKEFDDTPIKELTKTMKISNNGLFINKKKVCEWSEMRERERDGSFFAQDINTYKLCQIYKDKGVYFDDKIYCTDKDRISNIQSLIKIYQEYLSSVGWKSTTDNTLGDLRMSVELYRSL